MAARVRDEATFTFYEINLKPLEYPSYCVLLTIFSQKIGLKSNEINKLNKMGCLRAFSIKRTSSHTQIQLFFYNWEHSRLILRFRYAGIENQQWDAKLNDRYSTNQLFCLKVDCCRFYKIANVYIFYTAAIEQESTDK